MTKVLLVSWGVFPGTTGSCVVVNNLARAFGKSEMVVVGEGGNVLIESTWGKELPQLIHLEGWSVPSRRGIKYTRWLSYPRMIKKISKIALKENCTSVLAIFPDEFWMFLAYRVSRKLNIPFYTWFHNTYLDNRTGFLKLVARYLQPRFFHHARTNFVMSDGMKSFFVDRYPEVNFTTLVHGFDIPPVLQGEIPAICGRVKFMFSGSVNESCREACERLFTHILNRPNSELHIFSGNTDFVEEMKLSGAHLYVNKFLPFSVFEKKISDYDILLLPHGFDGGRTEEEYKTIFPTRTIPLLYSNRPILAHSPSGSFFTEFLLEHECAEVVQTKNYEDIERGIKRLLEDRERSSEVVGNAIALSSHFDISNLSEKLRRHLIQ